MPEFLADEMLKSLCRWLRIFGVRAYYAGDFERAATGTGKITGAGHQGGPAGNWAWRPDSSPRGKTRKTSPGDDDLIKIAAKNRLVLLTRDEELGKRAADYVETVLFRTDRLDDQLILLAKKYKFKLAGIEKRTICPNCMGKLERAPKATIKEKVFPRVYSLNRVFWQCKKCGQVFWKGSHWREIERKLAGLKKQAAAQK